MRRFSPGAWAARTAELHAEVAAIAKTDLRWWLFAGGAAAAEPWGDTGDHVISDATPTADTFLGYREAAPADPIADAILRARAARTALRELGTGLPGQPLAVTIGPNGPARDGSGSVIVPSALDAAAFAIGDGCVIASPDDPSLPQQLAAVLAGAPPRPWRGATPYVCVSLGDDPIETVRHAHRRAWHDGNGPWLGLGRAAGLATVSTCHLVVDGYGHGLVTSRIAELTGTRATNGATRALRPLAPVTGAMPLAVAWRELPCPTPRALPLAYALGRLLYRAHARHGTHARQDATGRHAARFSPTFQIPIAPGDRDDPMRIRRRAAYGLVSVRFDDGIPEPFEVFEARARDILAREAAGAGLCTRLLAAARAAPAPLAWKRKSISATRAPWLDRFAEVIGGRACLSKIRIDAPLPPTCAVSSPARLATAADRLGGCVLTILDDGSRAAITACGSGLAGTSAAANELLDELLATVEPGAILESRARAR